MNMSWKIIWTGLDSLMELRNVSDERFRTICSAYSGLAVLARDILFEKKRQTIGPSPLEASNASAHSGQIWIASN
ncbi:MAG: hypothetical protein FIO03_09080 [Nitrosopumilales archaeon]|jgi:hypothetical protein|nr:hypothetical protein [Nitrosopumilales archaeon]